MPIPTREELDSAVRERLAGDPAFREQLLNDPRATVSALVGLDIPDAVRVTVHEESLTDVHLVIPTADSDEVGEADLELVSGGVCWADDSGTPNCV